MNPSSQQKIPTNWVEREQLRIKGQFWTPDWVADAMISYAVAGGINEIFDPAVGAGAFFLAAKRVSKYTEQQLGLFGCEIDPNALLEAQVHGLTQHDLAGVSLQDFVLSPINRKLDAVVANPPYIRHHRLSNEVKAQLKVLCQQTTGFTIDGRAGLHVYFLIKALSLLQPGGRLAFIMPADTVEGVFAQPLWRWITQLYHLDAVVTFAPEATPFPGVDTNALIFFIRHVPPSTTFHWMHCVAPHPTHLMTWVLSGFTAQPAATMHCYQRDLAEALQTGLSRPPSLQVTHEYPLIKFARVMRGIATGSNDFFFLTRQQATQLDLPPEFLKVALGRTRDVPHEVITQQTVEDADRAGRPTLVLALDKRPVTAFPKSVQTYLAQGEQQGLPNLALIKQRRPWYKMESRPIPPFLFAYLGRRNARFIRNDAGILPLTSFLCVYPRFHTEDYLQALWNVLSHPETVRNLALVGKSYGSGAIKVEPRSLEMLPLPDHIVRKAGLDSSHQLVLGL
ncbi:MAG: N-6 DNA methylase [Oscillochloridaceae bacterium umkhey_bin13]